MLLYPVKIRNESLNCHMRINLFNLSYSCCPESGTTIWQVIPVNTCKHHMPQFHTLDTFCQSLRFTPVNNRSEERRVGKECRHRWLPYPKKKKTMNEESRCDA